MQNGVNICTSYGTGLFIVRKIFRVIVKTFKAMTTSINEQARFDARIPKITFQFN